jgi:hypothetical protein
MHNSGQIPIPMLRIDLVPERKSRKTIKRQRPTGNCFVPLVDDK